MLYPTDIMFASGLTAAFGMTILFQVHKLVNSFFGTCHFVSHTHDVMANQYLIQQEKINPYKIISTPQHASISHAK